jgi:hypothetical protein
MLGLVGGKKGATMLNIGVIVLKTDVIGLKIGVTGLKIGIAGLKIGVAGLKIGIAGLKIGVAGLKIGFKPLGIVGRRRKSGDPPRMLGWTTMLRLKPDIIPRLNPVRGNPGIIPRKPIIAPPRMC